MNKLNYYFILFLLIILSIIYYYKSTEKFSNKFSNDCSQYGGDYNLCYGNGCTIMLNDYGVPFCTQKFLYEDI